MELVDIDTFAESIINYAIGVRKTKLSTLKNRVCKDYERCDKVATKMQKSLVKEIKHQDSIVLCIQQKKKTCIFATTEAHYKRLRSYYYIYNLEDIIGKEHVGFKDNIPQFVYMHWQKFNEKIQILLDAIQVYT